MPLPLGGEQVSGRVERRVIADRGQDVVQLLVLRAGVASAVGRDEREIPPPGQIHERLVAVLLLAQPVPPDLDVEPPGEDRREADERLPSRLEPSPRESPRERPLLAARQAVEPPACASTSSSVTLVSPLGLPAAPAVIRRQRFL